MEPRRRQQRPSKRNPRAEPVAIPAENADLHGFVSNYFQRFHDVIDAWDRGPLQEVVGILDRVRDLGGTTWVAGNGGSASIANHLVCDLTKGTFREGRPPFRALSLASNDAIITALANDCAYEDVFRQQLVYYLRNEDALLLVSSSGNSPNVVEACRYAKSRGIPTIALVGFKGGALAELADVTLWVPVDNYGMAEDTHQSILHCLTQFLRHRTEIESTA